MVYVTAIVPAENEVAVSVSESVKIKDVLIDGLHGLKLERAELTVQFVEYPSNGSCGYEFSGHNSVADLIVDELQFSFWIDHFDEFRR